MGIGHEFKLGTHVSNEPWKPQRINILEIDGMSATFFLENYLLWSLFQLLMSPWHSVDILKLLMTEPHVNEHLFVRVSTKTYKCEWLDSNLTFFFFILVSTFFSGILSALICWMRARAFSFIFQLTLAPKCKQLKKEN